MEEYIISLDVYEGNEIVGTNSTVMLEFSIGKAPLQMRCRPASRVVKFTWSAVEFGVMDR